MIILGLIVLGVCLGSFVNALVWRVHEQSKPKKKRRAGDKDLSIMKGRSMCSNCQHPLALADLIPILSWAMLRGRCRYCGRHIEDSPIIEILTPLLFVASYVLWPYTLSGWDVLPFVTWLLAVVLLIALAVYDLRWMLLPNRLVTPLTVLAGLSGLVTAVAQTDWHPIGGMFWGAVVGGGFFYVLFQISKGAWIGGGDVKLGLALGLLLGSGVKSLMVLFLASLLGTLIAAPLIATGRLTKRTRIPFGPLLIIAAGVVQLRGDALYAWYLATFLGL